MKKFFRNEKGFTLVELMIVIVIVGILAAVAVPIYTGNVNKAKQSECDAALGTIRTALRVYYAENGAYPLGKSGFTIADWDTLGLSTFDLTGKYFAASTYKLTSDATTYTITCDTSLWDPNRTLDHDGNFGGGF